MSGYAELIEAVSTLIWPVIVLVIVFRFSPAVARVIESARSRKFTVVVGGQELTMEEVSDQQGTLIADLQSKVVQLQTAIESVAGPTPEVDGMAGSPRTAMRVLWVDDKPKNNSYFVKQLTDDGVVVDLSPSTSDALEQLQRCEYSLIISDMGRQEHESYNASAGLDLLKKVNELSIRTPVVFFCSRQKARHYQIKARELGARTITSSATELSGVIREILG